MNELMKCGHAATGTDLKTGKPCCVTCIGLDPRAEEVDDQPPDLMGRLARCSCGNTKPSSVSLAFFEYLGPGSPESLEYCKCGYGIKVHQLPRPLPGHLQGRLCDTFTPRGPSEFDHYYCGCRGWD